MNYGLRFDTVVFDNTGGAIAYTGSPPGSFYGFTFTQTGIYLVGLQFNYSLTPHAGLVVTLNDAAYARLSAPNGLSTAQFSASLIVDISAAPSTLRFISTTGPQISYDNSAIQANITITQIN